MSGIILQRCVSMWGFVVVIVLTQQEANDREVRDLIKSHKTFFFFFFFWENYFKNYFSTHTSYVYLVLFDFCNTSEDLFSSM